MTEFEQQQLDNKFQTIQEIMKELIIEQKKNSGSDYTEHDANNFMNMLLAENQHRIKKIVAENAHKSEYEVAKVIVDKFYEKSVVNSHFDKTHNRGEIDTPNQIVGETGMNQNENRLMRYEDFLYESSDDSSSNEYYIYKNGKEVKVSKKEYLNSIFSYENS